MEKLEYNNSLFSPKGKLNRLFYALHNAFWFLIGFRYIYYPGILSAIQSSPQYPQLVEILSSNSQTSSLVPYISSTLGQSPLDLVLKYVFILILRMVDIKRIRDLVNRNLSIPECAAVIVGLSLPYIDFFSTIALVLLPSNKFAKNEIHEEVRKKDLGEARHEESLQDLKRRFEAGKISRAEFESALKKRRPY